MYITRALRQTLRQTLRHNIQYKRIIDITASITNMASMEPDVTMNTKFINGKDARDVWSKELRETDNVMKMEDFNNICCGVFTKGANIVLDHSEKRQSTLKVEPVCSKLWGTKKEFIYLIVRNGFVLKIGGTRDGMKGRWGSYGCGYYVPQRTKKDGTPYPGKMSVTNAYLYHTIEKDLLENKSYWEFYIWDLPITTIEVDILGIKTQVIAQTFHAYETCTIKKFKEITGVVPVLCDNCDPNYK